jgi:hypothetical protein
MSAIAAGAPVTSFPSIASSALVGARAAAASMPSITAVSTTSPGEVDDQRAINLDLINI